jgi:hypothetical protein
MEAVEKTGQISIEMAKLQVKPIIAIKKILSPEQLKEARNMIRSRARQFRGSSDRRPPQRWQRDDQQGGREGGEDQGPEPGMMPPPPMEE